MPYKFNKDRKKHYEENKDEINKKRRKYCKKPEVRERKSKEFKKWRDANLEKARRISKESKRKYDKDKKDKVFNHYGKECSCCGESEIIFLTIDHMNGNGTKHRKKIQNRTYGWLVKNNFPEGFQTLCFNCNWGRYKNGGICPHKKR